jgi:hypothetical protein
MNKLIILVIILLLLLFVVMYYYSNERFSNFNPNFPPQTPQMCVPECELPQQCYGDPGFCS